MNLLALDIGNTSTDLGFFQDGRLVATSQASTKEAAYPRGQASLLRRSTAHLGELDAIAIASVVPKATDAWNAYCNNRLHLRPFVISGATPTRLKNTYHPPKRLGPDRLMVALAAAEFYKPPLICASLGTATVVDAVSADYEYLGGAIMPGLRLFTVVLSSKTAQLPQTELAPIDSPIGTNTDAAIRVGALLGTVGAIEGLAARMRERIGKRAKLIITGGYAPLVTPYFTGRVLYRSHLALEGIWLAWRDREEYK